jgi:hypothetical protein
MKTYINFILDRSGSMASVWDDTIGGFNAWLENQQKAEGKQSLTVTLFDTEIETRKYGELDAAPRLTKSTYVPGGMTALLDAIGKTIKSVSAKAKKVIVVIYTDGYENSSHEYTRAAIKELIKERELEGWTFAYLGATQAGFAEAGSLGIGLRSQYAQTGKGTEAAFLNLSGSTMAYAAAPTADAGFTAVKNNTLDTIPEDITPKMGPN